MKIYNDDPNLPYKTTSKTPMHSKNDIEGELAKWGIKKTAWTWDIENPQEIELQFELNDKFQELLLEGLVIRLKPPMIWQKETRKKHESVDLKISMRVFWWWIHNQLAMTYAQQSQKFIGFLPFIAVNKNQTVKDIIIPELSKFKALPEKQPKIIEVE